VPELPEVEHLRRTLTPFLEGARVIDARLRRRDVLTPCNRRSAARDLLTGDEIVRLDRLGKQLAVVSASGRVLCIHLGMTGQLRVHEAGEGADPRPHVHCEWTLHTPRGPKRLTFRDPRRFGGLWAFESVESLHRLRWRDLGPDALTIAAGALAAALAGSRRPVKAALLDQAAIAGVGNIYADESLHFAGIHPLMPAARLDRPRAAALAAAIRRVLNAAIRRGGSTLRDYVDAGGTPGAYHERHQVYGRAGLPCRRCDTALQTTRVAQRTTVYCPSCQPMVEQRF
jgi:formamidopyrimidine-DNA glycosylase